MPQMSPMMWSALYIMFNMSLMMMMIMIYFNIKIKQKKSKSNTYYTKNNWMW
nr:ATP synthase F0 subunit 8 [Hypselosoma matsumurae]